MSWAKLLYSAKRAYRILKLWFAWKRVKAERTPAVQYVIIDDSFFGPVCMFLRQCAVGHTSSLDAAGLFSLEEATRICEEAGDDSLRKLPHQEALELAVRVIIRQPRKVSERVGIHN